MFSAAVLLFGHPVEWVAWVSCDDFSAEAESFLVLNAHDVAAGEYPMLSSLSILAMETA